MRHIKPTWAYNTIWTKLQQNNLLGFLAGSTISFLLVWGAKHVVNHLVS